MQAILFLTLMSFNFINAKTICYGDLGCFQDTFPFGGTKPRPIAVLPDKPEKISTSFKLYNEQARQGEKVNGDYVGEKFNVSVPTKVLIHGFSFTGTNEWVVETKNALVNSEPLNVIVVDWSAGSSFPYSQATVNAQVVGAELAKLIKSLCQQKGAQPAYFHLIGHCLGAHVAGYAGERIIGLSKITGLDPAGLYFENTDPRVRLDPSDAEYVEVIHTDGLASSKKGFGLFQTIGHTDYYPNGGVDQPKCFKTSDKLLKGVFNDAAVNIQGQNDILACSHYAATLFYLDSIKSSCKYTAFPCSSQADFEAAKCIECGEVCLLFNTMGYRSEHNNWKGAMFLSTHSTTDLQPYCKQSYRVDLFSNDIEKLVQTRGIFTIYFQSESGDISSVELLDDGTSTFRTNSIEKRLVSLGRPLSDIAGVFISFTKKTSVISSWLYDNKWSFKFVDVFNGDTLITQRFCPSSKSIIETTKTVKFEKCSDF